MSYRFVQRGLQVGACFRKVAFGTAQSNFQRLRDLRMILFLKYIQIEDRPVSFGQRTDGIEDFRFGEVGGGNLRFLGIFFVL